MGGVAARPEHGREIAAGILADRQLEAVFLRTRRPVSADVERLAVGEADRLDIDGVGVGVLAELRAALIVAGSADVGGNRG